MAILNRPLSYKIVPLCLSEDLACWLPTNTVPGRVFVPAAVTLRSSNGSHRRGWFERGTRRLLEGCRKYLLMRANNALDSDLRPKAAASDLVQDSFVEVQRDFGQFRGTTEEELFGWLTTILSNRLAKNIRRHRLTQKRSANREISLEGIPTEALVAVSDAASPSAVVVARDEQRRVQAAMDRLPQLLRTVLIARTWGA